MVNAGDSGHGSVGLASTWSGECDISEVMPRLPAAQLSLKVGDRVRCQRGPAKDELGTIVERFVQNRLWSTSPRPGFVFVAFDRAQGAVADLPIDALVKVQK